MATLLRPQNENVVISDDGLLSIRDWLAMGETKPHYELINGQLVQKMTTTRKHSKAAGKFLTQCDVWGESSGWQFFPEGTGVYISERIGYIPDVTGFTPGVELDRNASMGSAPFLVVEVLSPATAIKDRTDKKRNYARIGVQIYILIDPDQRTLEVFRLAGTRYGFAETLRDSDIWKPTELTGLELHLEKLWM
ncbi:Uma2 family endonuclease [bacterium]|nr:MAG: Uma2 family endonuclease [bacterium]